MSEPESQKEAQLWLRYANEDLAAAEGLIEHILTPRHVCFLSQQAAEKAIKAVLVFSQIDFPRTHDLEALLQLVPEGWRIRGMTVWISHRCQNGQWRPATPEIGRRRPLRKPEKRLAWQGKCTNILPGISRNGG